MKPPTKKILIADDHDAVRKGLKDTLEELGQVNFGEARDGWEALEQIWKQDWDLVLLDINLGGRTGLEVLQEIHKMRSVPAVLILSMYPEEEFAVRAFKLGAAGYVSKGRASEELIGAVKKILAGGQYINATVAELLAADSNRESEQPLNPPAPVSLWQQTGSKCKP